MADWKTIYEEKFNESAKGYEEQKKQYEDAKAGEQTELQRKRDTAMANAKKDMENASQQAYISRVMAEKNMPQRLAAQGVSGGMAETTTANIFRDFLNSKNAANSAYSKASTELETGYMSDSAKINSSWAGKMADLDAQRQARALEQAKLAYQIAVDEEERRRREEEEQRKREEEERRRAEEEARKRTKPKNGPNTKPTKIAIDIKGGTSSYDPFIVSWFNEKTNKIEQKMSSEYVRPGKRE